MFSGVGDLQAFMVIRRQVRGTSLGNFWRFLKINVICLRLSLVISKKSHTIMKSLGEWREMLNRWKVLGSA